MVGANNTIYNKISLITLLVIILVTPNVLAKGLDINVNPIMTSVYSNSSASYEVIITNNYNFPVDISLTFPDLNWVGHTEPLKDYRMTLDKDETKVTKVLYRPQLNIPPGPYSVRMVVRDYTNDKSYNFDLPAYLRTPERDIDYVPS